MLKAISAKPTDSPDRLRSGPLLVLVWLVILALPVVDAAGATVADARPPATSGAEVVTEHLTARLLPEQSWVRPGGQIDLLLAFDLQPGWHTYWRNPGDSGEPPQLTWTLPEGVSADPIRWPYPHRIPVGPLANYGYSGQALHLIRLHIAPDWSAGRDIPIVLDAKWLVCAEHCIPESGHFELSLTSAPASPEKAAATADPTTAARFARARKALPEPLAAPALLDREARPMRLRLHRDDLPEQILKLEFFADEWGLIEHAADQPWQERGDWLELELSAGATPAAAAPAGVLVVTAADGVRALRLTATPQVLAPLADAGHGTGPDARTGTSALSLPLALLFALLGGLILNLMPCVFPVLAIKLLSLAEQRSLGLAARAWHALMYGSGVLVFFALLGAALLGLRAAGAAVGWGFQLQSPVFVALMSGLFLVLGLSLFGTLTLGTRLMSLGSGGPSLSASASDRARLDHAALAAFGTGALAALVAAPCTAPFMGAALGYALTLPWFAALAVVLALGLGMALPFALLTLFPAWTRRLPRPGVWMERLKQLLAFPLFATTAWLLWVLTRQTGALGLALALSGLLVLVFGLWLLEIARQDAHRWQLKWRLGLQVLAYACLLSAIIVATRLGALIPVTPVVSVASEAPSESGAAATHAQKAEPYSAAALEAARAEGRPVFVNMTAAWCITCLVNERVALASERVARAFVERDVLYLKGDWTHNDPAISTYLNAFGRDGVPLYVYYPPSGEASDEPGGEPVVLPQLLTPGLVEQALDAGPARKTHNDD